MTDDATINSLVAEHVLGWERVDIRGTWVRDGDDGERPIHARWRDPNALMEESHRLHGHPPDACNDGNVMLLVIEAMRKRGLHTTLSTLPAVATVGDYSYSWDANAIHAPDQPGRAIALAALKALGVEVPA